MSDVARSPVTAALLLAVLAAACREDRESPGARNVPMMKPVDVKAGDVIEVPIEVNETDAVALQLDLVFDPLVLSLKANTADRVLRTSSKELSARPLHGGRARVVVFGVDLDPIPMGRLGVVRLTVLKDAAAAMVRVEDLVVSDREGRMREVTVADGRVQISKELRHVN